MGKVGDVGFYILNGGWELFRVNWDLCAFCGERYTSATAVQMVNDDWLIVVSFVSLAVRVTDKAPSSMKPR